MQITRVELRNIKNHTEAEWTFEPGVIAICGPNGAGKTTILEAIAWALFDHLDYKRDDFVKRGAKRGQVVVGFISDLDQREYIVQRDTGGGYFVYDPTTKTRLVEQKNQVVPWLQQHIGVDPGTDLAALFKTTIGVPQGAFTYDFTLQPANRKGVFDQILKVEEYRQASDNLRDTLRHIEGRITEADRRLAEAEGELKAYDEIKRQHEETVARLAQLEAEQLTAAAERDRAAAEVEQLDAIKRQADDERRTAENLQTKLQLTRGQLSSAREAAEQAREAAATVEAARAGYESYSAAARRLAELERQREARDELRERTTRVDREFVEARAQIKLNQDRLGEVAQAREESAALKERIGEQEAIEKRIAELRESRGEMQSLRRSMTALDRELDKLRQRYADLSRQIEQVEAKRELAERADGLEKELRQLDDEISEKEQSFNNYRLKCGHLESLRTEVARLAGERKKNTREVARLEPMAGAETHLAAVEAQQQSETEKLARLRAEVARDAEMIASLESGGVCPLLTEKCLNLKPGESLDDRFRAGLEMRRREIEQLAATTAALTSELKQWRTAAAEASRLPHLREEQTRIAVEIQAQQARVAQLEEEIAAGSVVTDAEIQTLKEKRRATDARLREARQAERLYSQAEVLNRQMAEIKQEGENKRSDRDEIAGRIAKFGDLETQMAEAEAALRALNDPRGRSAALAEIISRETEWRGKAEEAERKAAELSAKLEQLQIELQVYVALDAEIASASATRAASERDYHLFIANEKIAATLDARQSEVAAITAEIEQSESLLASARSKLQELEARYDPERHRRVQTELDCWRERATQIATQLEHTREQHRRLQAQIDHLHQVREQMRCELLARERSLRLREAAEFIREILQKAAPFITETYLYSISIEANQIFREITGRFDVTLRWNKDYEITLEEEGRERPFANLSGGEQMAAALAVRLALLKELSDIKLAFFDEPTINMDEERRSNLAQQIGRIKDFHQLFVISHDDSFEGYTDQVIVLGAKS
jgi:exonuclease SbcC